MEKGVSRRGPWRCKASWDVRERTVRSLEVRTWSVGEGIRDRDGKAAGARLQKAFCAALRSLDSILQPRKG